MSMNSTCCQFGSGCSTESGLFALASCTRSLRLAAAQLNLLVPGRSSRSTHPHPEGLSELKGGSPAFARTAGRIIRCISVASLGLLFGAAVLLWGTHTAYANTLTFVFADDGTNSTITPSGSIDLSGLNHTTALNEIGSEFGIDTSQGRVRIWASSGQSSNSRRLYDQTNVSVSGIGSYGGTRYKSNMRNYVSPFHFEIRTAGVIRSDEKHLSGGVYEPTGSATFDGTLQSEIGDDFFHFEYVVKIDQEDDQMVIFTTAPTAPSAPEDFSATPDDGQLTLSWTDPRNTSISSYEIQQKSEYGDYSDWEPIEGSGKATTSLTIDGLKNGERYSFRIRAVNLHGAGAQSDELTAAPVIPGAPAAAELSAVSTEEDGQVVLSWTLADDSSITEWQFQQREGDAAFGDNWTAIDPSNAATRSHTIDGLSGEVTYGFRVRAVNGNGNGVASRMATATPKAPEPEPEPMEPEPTGPTVEMEKQVLTKSLAAAGQSTLAGVTNIIDQRMQSTPGPSALVLGGQTVAATGSSMNPATGQETDGWWSGNHASGSFNRPVGDADLLDGSAFTLSLSEEDGSDRGWTIWGHGDLQRFEGKTGEDSWDGSVKSAVLGFDTRTNESLLAGLAVSKSRGNIDLVTDDVGSRTETSLTAAWPYMQMAMPSGNGTVRVVLGVGSGDAEHHSDDGEVERAGLSMTAASVGASWAVAQQGEVTLSVPVKAEVVQLKTDGDGTTAIGGLSIKSWRASGGLEAAHSGVALDAGWVLIPRGSVSFRWDGGDGVTGKGIEVGGGFGLHAPDSRLSLNASGRWLATHSDDNQREWGASIGVQIAPDSQGRGWSASLRQEWGLQQEDALSDDTLFESSTGGPASTLGSLAARAGYGFGMKEGLMTLSADARLATGEEEVPHYGAGLEFALPRGLTATLRGEHVDAINPETRIGAGVHLNF